MHWHGKPDGMRKSFDGLQALVRQGQGCDPLSGQALKRSCGASVAILQRVNAGC